MTFNGSTTNIQGSGGDAGAELTITDSHSNVAIFINADDVKIVELYLWFKGAETLRLLFGDDNSTVCKIDSKIVCR